METENAGKEIPAAKNFFKAVTLLASFFLLVTLLNLLLYFPAKFFHLLPDLRSLFSQALALVILIFLQKPQAGLCRTFFNVKAPVQLYFIIVLLSILLMITMLPLVSKLPVIYDAKEAFNGLSLSFLVAYGALVVPILEEIFFRGIILGDFLRIYSSKKAIIYSGILFGAVHINPPMILFAFTGGLILGWLYCKTGTLVPCIVLHATTNALNGVIYHYLSPSGAIFGTHGFLYVIFYLVSLSLLVASLIFTNRLFKKEELKEAL
ncbi:MAG: CPBP family intramembrane metalloprotease [Ignavibacteria bacterium]|nr:CPBP family intramembrane metalloprotease [Ignavibacteria bacterium]MCU7502323.1 CPBP family intramembrane metalloprotease [Ignavibacteria bacterium]MCU7518500.1 CPBP family intramembrane metalloprotease [Ignavibacteria bacterium]